MKKIFTLLMTIALVLSLNAQTTKTMQWGDSLRTYLEYVPASYNANTPAPVLFVLHGLGDDMSNMFEATGFKNIADQHGWIVVTPQALIAKATLFGQTMTIGTAWNSGVRASLYGQTLVVSEGVDDSGFLMAILDDLIAHYNVDQDNVFSTGFSMGGLMSNRLAIEHGDRLKAIASVSGPIGNVVQDNTPVAPVSAMHIHGTADGTIAYTDASFSMSGVSMGAIGLGAEATVEFWRAYNQCGTTPTVTAYPDAVADNLTFEKSEYTGGTSNTRVALIKVTGGDHDWYYTPANDIDYTTEIYNFFAACMQNTGISENVAAALNVYPNPATTLLNVEAAGAISEVAVYDLSGRMVLSHQVSEEGAVALSIANLSAGTYVVKVQTQNGIEHKTFVKR